MPRRRPRPGAGQLTLEQALCRAVRKRDLPETDSEDPSSDPTSDPAESDRRDDDWHPPRHAHLDSSEDSDEFDEEEETEGERGSEEGAGATASSSRELQHSSEEGTDEEAGAPASFRRARLESSDEGEEEEEVEEEVVTERVRAAAVRKRGSSRAGKSRQEDSPRWRSMPDWSPTVLPFTAVPGPRNAAASLHSDKPADFLELFVCDELLQIMVEQTNIYAQQCIAALDELHMPYTRVNAWQPLSVGELKRFLGLLFLTGLIKKPKIADYWSLDVALETPYFRKTMPRNRFQLIWRFLHFCDNQRVDATDRLHKVRLILDLLLSKFKEMYQPSQNISVDEGMLLWRGRLRFRVYNPAKPIKYGIKSYILCDSENGYCYAMKPYCGLHSTLLDTVQFLIAGLEGYGYRLWMDNFYNSGTVSRQLLSLQMHSAGTLRVNRGEPASIRQVTMSSLGVGERLARHEGRVMFLAWRDKRIVRMISTFHQDEMKTVAHKEKGQSDRVLQSKPACVVEYNQYMSGVDRLDQKISYYPFVRKTSKWSSKFVVYLMQIAMSNAFTLYRKCNPTSSCKALKDFTLSVVKSWTEATSACPPPPPPADEPPPLPPGKTPRHTRERSASVRQNVDFAGHVPQPVKVPPTKSKAYRKCAHCAAKGHRKETKFVCPQCDHVPLCLYPCFFEYHSL